MPQFIFTAAIPSLEIPDTRFYIEANNPFEGGYISAFEEDEDKVRILLARIQFHILFDSDIDSRIHSEDRRISVPLAALAEGYEDREDVAAKDLHEFLWYMDKREDVAAKDLHEYLWYMDKLEGFVRYGGVTNQEWVEMTDPFFLQKGIVE